MLLLTLLTAFRDPLEITVNVSAVHQNVYRTKPGQCKYMAAVILLLKLVRF